MALLQLPSAVSAQVFVEVLARSSKRLLRDLLLLRQALGMSRRKRLDEIGIERLSVARDSGQKRCQRPCGIMAVRARPADATCHEDRPRQHCRAFKKSLIRIQLSFVADSIFQGIEGELAHDKASK